MENESKFLINIAMINYQVNSIIAYGHHTTSVKVPKILSVTLVQAFFNLLAECLTI